MRDDLVGQHDCNLARSDGSFVVECKCGNRTRPHEWELAAWIEHRRHVDEALAAAQEGARDG